MRLAYGCPDGPAGVAGVLVINAAVDSLFRGLTQPLDKCMAKSDRETFEVDVDAAMRYYEQTAPYYAVEEAKRQARSTQWDGTPASNAAEADK